MNGPANQEGGASAPLDLFAQDDAVNAALAECRRLRGELEAERTRTRHAKNSDNLLEPFYIALDAAEAKLARLEPRTLPGLAASAEWFISYRDHAPSDAELEAWPVTIERALVAMARP